jgi:hypothetical protein
LTIEDWEQARVSSPPIRHVLHDLSLDARGVYSAREAGKSSENSGWAGREVAGGQVDSRQIQTKSQCGVVSRESVFLAVRTEGIEAAGPLTNQIPPQTVM